jgi:hypothetical protein
MAGAGAEELHAQGGRAPAQVEHCTRAGGVAAGGKRRLNRPGTAGRRRRTAGRIRANRDDQRGGDAEQTPISHDVHRATVGGGANRALTAG